MAGIFLNGTEFFPSDAPKETTKVGKALIMDNGDRHWVQRVDGSSNPIHKRKWELNWQDVGNSVRAAVEAIALLATTFTYTDQHGTSYTVQCEEGAYKDKISYIGTGNVLYYNVDLTIYQA
jgi:hypothetical protein